MKYITFCEKLVTYRKMSPASNHNFDVHIRTHMACTQVKHTYKQ